MLSLFWIPKLHVGRWLPWKWKDRLGRILRPLTGLIAEKELWHFPPARSPWIEFVYVAGFYERSTLRQCLSILRAGDVVVDVGAHLGYFARYFALSVGSTGRVIAIEPHPFTANLLRANTAQFPQVEVIEAAAIDTTGDGSLWETRDSDQHTLVPFDRPETGGMRVGQVRVSTVRLDDVLRETVPRLVKMDIEGSEPAALRGLRGTIKRAREMYLAVEFAPRTLRAAGVEPTAFLRELRSQGFVIQPVDGPASQLEQIPTDPLWVVNLWCAKRA